MKKYKFTLLFPALIILSFLTTAVSSPQGSEHVKYGIPGTCSTCQTLYREGYIVCEDTAKKIPLWVSYHLTKDYLVTGTEKRVNYKFLPDPNLPPGERATNKDYSKSGYDKGHMCPAADENRNPTTMKECFYLSNMCPQWPQLNRHPWEQLEVKVRALAVKYGEIWVIVGPLFEKDSVSGQYKPEEELGPDHVWVPWGFYKIVIFTEGSQLHALAFQYRNQDETFDIPAHEVTVKKIEQETGLDFLSALPDNEKQRIEIYKATEQEINTILN